MFERSLLLAAALTLISPPAFASDAVPTEAPQATPPARSGIPWLGVSMDNGGDIGVRIEHVMRGSPAERAGLRAGDRIVMLDGSRVTSPSQISHSVASRKVGDSVAVAIERTGTASTITITLAARPSSDDLVKMHLVGASAPAFRNVTVLTGAPSSVEALKGKVTLIDFWASWCGPCRLIAPRLGTLKDRLGAQGFTVVGVTTDDPTTAAAFAEKHQMRYPSVVDNDGDTSRAYGIVGLPTMVLVDKKGIVRDVFVGFDPTGDARMEAMIKKLLSE